MLFIHHFQNAISATGQGRAYHHLLWNILNIFKIRPEVNEQVLIGDFCPDS